jgi:hypothetical protein
LSTVSGAGATLLSKYVPPDAGQEVRAMIGWESYDSTTRVVVHQAINGGTVRSSFKKAPALAGMACTWNMEIPATPAVPFEIYTAGTARVGV